MKKRITYRIVKLLWVALSAIPLRLLYLLSDFFYFLVYYVVGYRKKVVFKNLQIAYPTQSYTELEKIAKGFYRFLCDLFFETAKFRFWGEQKIKKHITFVNTEEINSLIADKRSVTLFLGHYGNWEWIPSMTLWLDKNIVGGADLQKTIERYCRPSDDRKPLAFWVEVCGDVADAKTHTLSPNGRQRYRYRLPFRPIANKRGVEIFYPVYEQKYARSYRNRAYNKEIRFRGFLCRCATDKTGLLAGGVRTYAPQSHLARRLQTYRTLL